MNPYLVAFAIAVVVFITLYHLLTHTSKTTCQTHVKSPEECNEIIACKGAGVPKVENVMQPLESQAEPNQRLTRVFGMDNSFTTVEEDRNKRFRDETTALLKATDWNTLQDRAQKILGRRFDDAVVNGESPLLKAIVQSLTLRLALQLLFEVDACALDEVHVQVVAAEIDRLWTLSKDEATEEPFKDQHLLRISLKGMLPEASFEPTMNPLNLIIPAYETMWRVALLGYVEVLHKQLNIPDGDIKRTTWLETLHEFLTHPAPVNSSDEIATGKADIDKEALRLAAETLRIYPSTRRIYRQLHLKDEVGPKIVSVDLQKTQRAHTGKGNVFDPHAFNKQPRFGFLAFGVRPFICPASSDFGERMVALLIATLIEGTKSSWSLDTDADPSILQRSHLPSGRGDFMGWRLRKIDNDVDKCWNQVWSRMEWVDL